MHRRINPTDFPPMGAYSQGMVIPLGPAKLIVTSGQIATDDAGRPLAPGNLDAQTRLIFDRITEILGEAGATLSDIVKVQIFITDMTRLPEVSAVRNEYLAEVDPVSTLVEISATVVDGCEVEIEVMAVVNG